MHIPLLTSARTARIGLGALAFGLGCAVFAPQRSDAALSSLIDQNSTADFDTATGANNYNWFVDGADKLAQQAFWYRIGVAGPELSVHTLQIGVQGTTDSNFDGNPDTLFVRYNGNGVRFETTYVLRGGAAGSGASDLSEVISITNTGAAGPLDLHFFQYADFDLSAADTVTFTNPNAVQQSGGATTLNETVVTPIPTHHEAGFFPVTLNKLNDGVPTTLSDLPLVGVPIGAGDMTWAFEWDLLLAPGDTFQISKDKNMDAHPIPEPATAAALTLCVGMLALRRR